MKHNPGTIAILALIALTSCTYTISMAHTEGTASDTIDDTSTPTADVTATATIEEIIAPECPDCIKDDKIPPL